MGWIDFGYHVCISGSGMDRDGFAEDVILFSVCVVLKEEMEGKYIYGSLLPLLEVSTSIKTGEKKLEMFSFLLVSYHNIAYHKTMDNKLKILYMKIGIKM